MPPKKAETVGDHHSTITDKTNAGSCSTFMMKSGFYTVLVGFLKHCPLQLSVVGISGSVGQQLQ
jgi:hypothetical protein